MKRLHALLLAAAMAFLPGCGDDDDPTGPKLGPVVQFDLRAHFDSDVVVNNGRGAIDTTQSALDDSLQGSVTNFALVTQSVAEEVQPSSPDGLPDDGSFPSSAFHPEVQLAYRNGDDGLNAVRFLDDDDQIIFDVPASGYEEIHLFALSGQGSTNLEVTLNYDDGAELAGAVSVPDWFFDVTDSVDSYALIDGMDRMNRGGGTYDNRNAFAVFGFRLLADPDRRLRSLTVERTSASSTGTVGTVLGALGVRPD